MCSVVGYIGSNLCRSYVLQGLSRLEYRGYDSAGFACIDTKSKKIVYAKTEGPLENLVKQIIFSGLMYWSGSLPFAYIVGISRNQVLRTVALTTLRDRCLRSQLEFLQVRVMPRSQTPFPPFNYAAHH